MLLCGYLSHPQKFALILALLPLKPNIHDAIWLHTIYKSQHVHYKIVRLYVAYDVLFRIEQLSIPYDATKSYATKSQRVYWALHSVFNCYMYLPMIESSL